MSHSPQPASGYRPPKPNGVEKQVNKYQMIDAAHRMCESAERVNQKRLFNC
jgi:hypothetical protein